MSRIKFHVLNTGLYISVKEVTQHRISHALKLQYSKKGLFNPFTNSHKYHCAFCKKPNASWFFTSEISGLDLIVTGIDYHKPGFYCFDKGACPGKKLNPNSVEFVSAIRGVSQEAALKLIHTRNKSPFYKENHKSENEYAKYQGSRVFNKSEEDIKKIVEKQKYSRSLEGYKKRFGDKEGEEKWRYIQSQHAVSIESIQHANSCSIDEAKQKFINWKSKTKNTLDNFQKRYGPEIGLEKYRANIRATTSNNRTNCFGVVSVEDGCVLRSNLERKFFNALKERGITEFETDGYYPNSAYRFDFYFSKIKLYVEIAGISSPDYLVKLQKKKELFNPLVLTTKEIINQSKLECIMLKIQELLNANI